MKLGLDFLHAKLMADAHLSSVYRPYLKRIRASSLLYLAILANTGGRFGEARRYLREAVGIDFRLLASQRVWRVARRAWLKMQPH
jgi:hypothetical protein